MSFKHYVSRASGKRFVCVADDPDYIFFVVRETGKPMHFDANRHAFRPLIQLWLK